MDEIEYKLNTNNSVLVVNGIEKLISTIKSKYKPTDRQKFVLENEELKYLREKCSSKDTVVSLTACQGLLALVECGVLGIAHTMSTMITMIPSASNYSAVISMMGGLLILDLKSRLVPGQPYTCQFSLKSPQHPFITVLEKNPGAISDVYAQMQALCTHPDNSISSNSLELLRPVFLWLLCRPQAVNVGNSYWQLLLSLNQHHHQPGLLLECLSWQQICNPDLVESSFAAYLALTENAIYRQDWEYVVALAPMLARISNELIKHGRDPRTCYSLLSRCFSLPVPALRSVAGLTVLLLADNLSYSCALYLHELFNLCLHIINKFEYPSIVINSFVALSLQWLHLPSYLTENALHIAAKILQIQQTKQDNTKLNMPNLYANIIFQELVHTDPRLYTTFCVLSKWERVRDDPDKLRRWFDDLEEVDEVLKFELVPFLLGFVMETDVLEFPVRALKIVLGLVSVRNELAVQILPLLLYKLANDNDPNMKLECLRGIPLMAVTKENVPTIVGILSKLKCNKSVPTSLLVDLYSRLAEVQVRCYPYLREMLSETAVVRSDDLKWEVEIARAVAVRKICETRASSHGRELVAVIASILNRCAEGGSGVGCGEALEALGVLWREGVVGPPSTWRALEPKLGGHRRPEVLVSVCSLLRSVPTLRVQSADYDRLLSDTARRLWSYVAESHYPEVVEAACDALGEYRLQDYRLADIPQVYRKGVKLPPAYCKTPIDAGRRPEDVLDYIPCEIWPEVFKCTNQSALGGVRRLVGALVGREVCGYRSGVYQREGGDTLGYMQPYSVVKGMLEYIKRQATNPSFDCPDNILLEMLQCASSGYSKPLPPLDLCFLHDLYHRGRHMRYHCLLLGARQATVSPSGKQFVETYLSSFDPETAEESEILTVFQVLPQLCNAVSPDTLRSSIEGSLRRAYGEISSVRAKDTEVDPEQLLFVKLLKLTRECLDSEVHEANRTLLAMFIENYFTVISDDNVSWSQYVSTCCGLPIKHLERMTTPSSWWDVTEDLLRKALAIRCELASCSGSAAPLHWLNDVIDAAIPFSTEHELVIDRLRRPVRVCGVTAATREWFLQLMARTHVAFSETERECEKSFLCSVLAVSASVLSGHDALIGHDALNGHDVLPLALRNLFTLRDEWRPHEPQILEWLLHTARAPGLDSSTRRCCRRGMLSLRHASHYTTTTYWLRALGQNFTSNTPD